MRNAPAIIAMSQRSLSQFIRLSVRSHTLSSLLWSSRFMGIDISAAEGCNGDAPAFHAAGVVAERDRIR
jgi:hypothetical protein